VAQTKVIIMKYLTQLIASCPGTFNLVVNPHKADGHSVDDYMDSVSNERTDGKSLVSADIGKIMIDTDTIILMEFCINDTLTTFFYGHEVEKLAKVAMEVLKSNMTEADDGKQISFDLTQLDRKETLH
jgi:hypothetical protein